MKLSAAALLGALALATSACGLLDKITGTGGTTVVVTQTTTQTQGGGSTPSASPSPGSVSGAAPFSVHVGLFGPQTCPPGVSPSTAVRTVRVGCHSPSTCTPRLQNGLDAVQPLNITAPDSYSITSGGNLATLTTTEEPFNRDLRAGLLPGLVTLECTVRGIQGVNTIEIVAP